MSKCVALALALALVILMHVRVIWVDFDGFLMILIDFDGFGLVLKHEFVQGVRLIERTKTHFKSLLPPPSPRPAHCSRQLPHILVYTRALLITSSLLRRGGSQMTPIRGKKEFLSHLKPTSA